MDMVRGNSADDLRNGALSRPDVAGDDHHGDHRPGQSYRSRLRAHLGHAIRVADPFHVVRVANRCVDKVRRRVQHAILHHRGRKADPLYRIRKLLLAGTERLNQRGHDRMLLGLRIGDPHDEVLGAWLAKESVRDIYLTEDRAEAALVVDKAIAGCAEDDVEEIRSLEPHPRCMALGDPRSSPNRRQQRTDRRAEPVREEGEALRPRLPPLRALRLRVLLHAGGVAWPRRPSPPRIRARFPTQTRRANKLLIFLLLP